MRNNMILEDRYLVIRRKRVLSNLTVEEIKLLNELIVKIGVTNDEYLVINKKWPEYEPTLKLLSERVDNENSIHS